MDSSPFDRRAWPDGGTLDTWTAPDGWPLRRFRLGTGVRGRLLFVGGRGDSVEKYLEPMAHWARRGWRVTSVDWRGQGGSGRLDSDRSAFDVWIADLAAFVTSWEGGGTGPSVIVAHSMGGQIVLRAMVEARVAPAAAVLVAPMLGVNSGPIPRAIAPAIARAVCALGLSRRPMWRESAGTPFRQERLTHSAERYADELWWRAQTPGLGMGAPSWRWVAEAYASIRALERSSALATMRIPTLVLGTCADRLVSPEAITRISARLPAAQVHIYGAEAAHEILREADGVRLDALRRIDAFLDQAAPA